MLCLNDNWGEHGQTEINKNTHTENVQWGRISNIIKIEHYTRFRLKLDNFKRVCLKQQYVAVFQHWLGAVKDVIQPVKYQIIEVVFFVYKTKNKRKHLKSMLWKGRQTFPQQR